jgi:hypothetical protein
VLIDAIVIGEDGSGTNVGVFTNLSIPHIRKVWDLGATAYLGVLGLNKGPDFALRSQVGALSQVGKRTHFGAFLNGAVLNYHVWANYCHWSNLGCSAKMCPWMQYGVLANGNLNVNPCGVRVQNGNSR